MAYAQTAYPQLQGIPKQRYTIAQIGCFITSFSNIMQRFGVEVDPGRMNTLLVQRNLYIDVDDGVRDDVGWTTIVSLFPKNIRLEAVGNGAPTSNNSIVKFNYRSNVTGNFTTHFCLVQDAKAGTIIDSWDGRVKNWSVYGGPVSYATYSKLASAIAPTPQGEVKMTIAEEQNAYRIVLNRTMEHSGSGRTGYQFIAAAEAELKAQRTAVQNTQNALNKKIAEMQTAINSLSTRPTKEEYAKVQAQISDKVTEITQLQKALEAEKLNIKEKIVEIEKKIVQEVEKPYTNDGVLNWLKANFKTFVEYLLSKLRRK